MAEEYEDDASIEAAQTTLEAELAQSEIDMRARLRVEPEALEEEFVNLPMNMAHVSALYARAIGRHLRARVRAKKLRGWLMMQARTVLKAAGKATIGDVEATVDQDPRWIEAKLEEDAAEVMREKLRGDLEAMRGKKDMLVQMGANARAEAERDPVIRERMKAAREWR